MYSAGVIVETLKSNLLMLITSEGIKIMHKKHCATEHGVNAIINQSKILFSAANTVLTGGYRPSRISCAELQI